MQNGNSHSVVGLDFEVVPENCLRNEHIVLALGTPINLVLSALKNVSRLIRKVDLIYDSKEQFNRDISIVLKNEGIRLTFDAKCQLLKLIEVYDFNHISLHYCNTQFSTAEQKANVTKVEHCFGATHPGVYDEKHKAYLLSWRGVYFSFPAKEPSTELQPTYSAHGLSSLNFSNSELPLLEKMGIFCGDNPNEIRIPEIPVLILCGNLYPIKIESVNDEMGILGLKITYVAEDLDINTKKLSELPQKQKVISFGDTEQSVIAMLGAPSKVFYKTEDKMLIQRGSESEDINSVDNPDIFYNYFSLGLDILLDFNTRRVSKFVLHTNMPGHYDFGEYIRPSFEIRWTASSRQNPFTSEPVFLRTDSRLETFRSAFLDESGSCNPVVINRTNEGAMFGPTFAYGNQQIIVEVMDNEQIATLTIYESSREGSINSAESIEDADEMY